MKQCLPSAFAFAQRERFPLEMHHLLYLDEFAGISCVFLEQLRMIACVAPERKTF